MYAVASGPPSVSKRYHSRGIYGPLASISLLLLLFLLPPLRLLPFSLFSLWNLFDSKVSCIGGKKKAVFIYRLLHRGCILFTRATDSSSSLERPRPAPGEINSLSRGSSSVKALLGERRTLERINGHRNQLTTNLRVFSGWRNSFRLSVNGYTLRGAL